ncbi:MAG: enoyl-CoA hydratase-related protein [Treponema sp.]|nr:enoyl-CoA hydratase-related protein [Treponema sp.]
MEFIKTEQQGHVLIITINRPDALNALNRQVLSELKTCVEGIDPEKVRCVVITGSGNKAFVAGADIAQMKSMTKAEGKEFGLFGNSVFSALEELPVPVIAAVNGFALGGGSELALACDIRIASDNAVFGQPEVALGITAGFGATQRLPRLIGEGQAKRLLFTGERVKADEALQIGLVCKVFPIEELIEKALAMANAIAANGPIAIRGTKVAIKKGLAMDLKAGLELEAGYFGDCFETKDQVEGMSAMLEKRKPEPFTGK